MIDDRLLRSIVRFSEKDDEEQLVANLYMLRHEVQEPEVDGVIIDFVCSMYDRTQIIPSLSICQEAWKNADGGTDAAAAMRVDTVAAGELHLLSRPEFRLLLDQHKEYVLSESVQSMLLRASSALTSGTQIKGKTLQGPEAALSLMTDGLNALTTQLKRGSIEGSFRKDGALVRKKYAHWKSHPEETVGVLTGIDKLDIAHRGAKLGELVLVAGFVSHLKTSFCLNWLYRGAVDYNRNVALVSLETPVDVLRTLIFVMHSAHSDFEGRGPLDYDKVTTGNLTPEEELLLEDVITDFGENPNYGEIYYKEPEESLTMADIQRWAEDRHRRTPLDMVVIDYLGLVDPGKGASSLDSGANLNKVVRQAKMLSLTFANSRGVAIVSPFQTNREGLKDAEKNAGKYKLTALANANESERSSDVVYYVYLDELLRNSRELLVGNMKTRNGPLVQEPFKVFADPSTRVIGNLDMEATGGEGLVEI